MELRLQELEDKHTRQTEEQRQQSLAEDTKEIQELERMAREHLINITDKMTRTQDKKTAHWSSKGASIERAGKGWRKHEQKLNEIGREKAPGETT